MYIMVAISNRQVPKNIIAKNVLNFNKKESKVWKQVGTPCQKMKINQ